jgi:hypothetical protein
VVQTTTDSSGFIYLLVNPAFPEWVKVGKTIDTKRRLRNYQTGDPFRLYRLVKVWPTPDRHRDEALAELYLEWGAVDQQGEWFRTTAEQAIRLLDPLFQ